MGGSIIAKFHRDTREDNDLAFLVAYYRHPLNFGNSTEFVACLAPISCPICDYYSQPPPDGGIYETPRIINYCCVVTFPGHTPTLLELDSMSFEKIKNAVLNYNCDTLDEFLDNHALMISKSDRGDVTIGIINSNELLDLDVPPLDINSMLPPTKTKEAVEILIKLFIL